MNAKVSVIIPFYNVKEYFRECVDSVLEQTLPEVEAVLVDDGSDDGSEKIADDYARDYPGRVKVVHKENGGASSARNAGIDVAEGEYVYFLDSDDRLKKHALQFLYDEASAEDLDILLFNAEVFTTDPELFDDVEAHKDEFIREKCSERVTSGRESLRKFYENMTEEYPSPVWTRLYRREFLNKCGVRYPIGVIHEDEDFGFFTYYYAERIKEVGEVLLDRRLRRDSVMYTRHLIDSARGYANAYLKVISLAEEERTGPEDREMLIKHGERHIFYSLLLYLRSGEEERKECRPVFDTYLPKAIEYKSYYCEKVRRAMSSYAGELPESEVSLPELLTLCYI